MASDLAVSADELPSTDELMACWRRCTDLRQAVKERQAGGTALARAVVAASFVSSFDVQAAAVPSLGLGQCRHWRSSNLWRVALFNLYIFVDVSVGEIGAVCDTQRTHPNTSP